ncbi:MAG: TonB-dependent receptor [Bacteroidales bacterium]|nr:TonB-dependent receptor [Bacteroidales bacterium]MCF8389869.1 TonB-dependent receptor [Bacteroidales bacterium]
MWKKVIFALFFVSLFSSITVWSQGKLIIYDKETGHTLPFAHVCFESMDKLDKSFALTDENGQVQYNVNKPSIVSVSFVGYHTLLDTIIPGSDIELFVEPSFFNVGEVVVTAQFSPKKLDESIYKVKVIDNSVVEKKGATNLSELISNELNFSPTRDAALGSSVRIQGLGGEHVKILIDGVPMVGRQNGILDLSQINVASISHIEIVEGPMSVVYGSNAMAGVINIITKENTRQSLAAGIETYYETVGLYDVDGTFSVNKGKNSFGLSLGRNFFGGYSEVDTSRAKDWNPKLQYNLEGYYILRLNDWKAKLSASFFDEELRDNGNLNPDLNYEGAFDYYHFTKRNDSKLELNRNFDNCQAITITGAYSFYEKVKVAYLNDLVNLEKSVIPDASANDTTSFVNYFSRGTYSNEKFERLTFQGGYEVNIETAESKRIEDIESVGDIATYLSVNALPLKNLSFQPGVRYIYNLKYKAPLVFSMNIKSELFKMMQLRASYAKGFRSPSIKELYLNFQDINHNIRGNPDLKAETGNNFNLWLDVNVDKDKNYFTFANNLYYNKIYEKIELLFDPDDPTSAIYFNVPAGAMISRGFSSDLTYKMHPRLTLNAGLFHNELSSIINTEEFTRSTDFASSFKYKNVKYKFELSVFYKYTDKYSRYVGSIDMETAEVYDVSLNYLDSYHNMDATLSIPFVRHSSRLTFGVKNIFDNQSITSSGGGGVHSGGSGGSSLLNWGRTWFLKLSYNFNKFND